MMEKNLFWEESMPLHIGREKIVKSSGDWRKRNEVKKLHIIMTVVIVFLCVSVAAGVTLSLLKVKKSTDRLNSHKTASASVSASSAAASLPVYDDSLNLMLVNHSKKIPEGYRPNLTAFDSVQVDAHIVPALEQLTQAAKAAGCPLGLKSGYVDVQTQDGKFQAEVKRLMTQEKLSQIRAEDKAQSTVGQGGYADSQTGLSVCFAAQGAESGAAFGTTAQYRWLQRNAADFGFILRYPDDSGADGINDKTQHIADTSCYRYVGQDAAIKMREYSMCMEEYVQYLANREN